MNDKFSLLKRMRRLSGILVHPTSLPGKFGIGDLGPEAYRLDLLADITVLISAFPLLQDSHC